MVGLFAALATISGATSVAIGLILLIGALMGYDAPRAAVLLFFILGLLALVFLSGYFRIYMLEEKLKAIEQTPKIPEKS